MRKIYFHFFLAIPLALSLLLFSIWIMVEQMARFMPVIQMVGLLIGLFGLINYRDLLLNGRKRSTHTKNRQVENRKKR